MTQECNNREKILLCAQRLFFEKGYDSVGVQEIVDTAGITKPTMYYYFKSKQGLLACLLEEGEGEGGGRPGTHPASDPRFYRHDDHWPC